MISPQVEDAKSDSALAPCFGSLSNMQQRVDELLNPLLLPLLALLVVIFDSSRPEYDTSSSKSFVVYMPELLRKYRDSLRVGKRLPIRKEVLGTLSFLEYPGVTALLFSASSYIFPAPSPRIPNDDADDGSFFFPFPREAMRVVVVAILSFLSLQKRK